MLRQVAIIILALSLGATVESEWVRQPRSSISNNNFCQGCRAIVSFSERFNAANHRAEYEDVFKNFCEFYYPTSTDFQRGPCPLFVKGLFTTLDLIDPVRHCDQIGACGPTHGVGYSLAPEIAKMPPKQASVICEFCEQTVRQVRDALSNNETINQVRRQANHLCDYFQVVDADKECRQLVNKYLERMLEFARNIDPLAYCRSVQLCGASSSNLLRPPKPLESSLAEPRKPSLPTLADFSNFGIETSVIVGASDKQQQQQQQQQQARRAKTPNCMLCKTFVKEMFHFLRENKTEANIVQGLNSVCQILFQRGNKLEECQSMVRAYTRELIQLLVDETDPEMICVLIELCATLAPEPNVIDLRPAPKAATFTTTTTTTVAPSKTFNLGDLIHSLDPKTKLKSAKICFECKMFIRYLRGVFDEPSSRDTIKSWLVSNLCQSIPDKETSQQCKRLVDEYADTFIAAVVGELDPAGACSDLGACTGKMLAGVLHIDTMAPFEKPDELPTFIVNPVRSRAKPETAMSMSRSEVSKEDCASCQHVVSHLDERLSDTLIDGDVSAYIDQQCAKFPLQLERTMCEFLNENFGNELMNVFVTMQSPAQACENLAGLCSNS